MDPLEEQQQEIEILESIYPDELKKISDTEYSINLILETDSERKHAIRLKFKYPETYPEVTPDLDLEFGDLSNNNEFDFNSDEEYDSDEEYAGDNDDDEDDEFADLNSEGEKVNKNVNLNEMVEFDEEDLKKLLRKLNEEAEENIGMPSIFALGSSLKDQGEQLFESKLKEIIKQRDLELIEKEKEEQKKFNGTEVTTESFNNWRNNFRKELKIDERIHDRFKSIHQGKLTGKEIFEKGLAGVAAEAESGEIGHDVDIQSLKKGLEKLNVK